MKPKTGRTRWDRVHDIPEIQHLHLVLPLGTMVVTDFGMGCSLTDTGLMYNESDHSSLEYWIASLDLTWDGSNFYVTLSNMDDDVHQKYFPITLDGWLEALAFYSSIISKTVTWKTVDLFYDDNNKEPAKRKKNKHPHDPKV